MHFKPGKYYVGDLCYAIEDWDAFCDLTIVRTGVLDGQFPWKSGVLWSHGTAFGDGSFGDNEGHHYGVDAGLIGVLPVEFFDKADFKDRLEGLARVVEFTQDFEPYYNDGVFHIGHITIDTNTGVWDDDDNDSDDTE